MITEKYLVRHFLGIQQFSGNGEPGSVFWLPGLANPADGMTQVKSDMAPCFVSWSQGRSTRASFDP